MGVYTARGAMQVLLAAALVPLGINGCHAGPQTVDAEAQHVRINQVGFLPGAQKLALVETAAQAQFRVLADGRRKPVLEGRLEQPARWDPAGIDVAVVDLGALAPGHYRLHVEGLPPSDPFVVDADAYGDVTMAALKAFYFNRVGMALDPAHAGQWARAAGHPDDAVLVHASAASPGRPAGSTISAPRGWYDAGDYGKYIVNSGISTWTLLAAWEHYPQFFRGRDAGIPESGDAVPDILDETLWNLQWMLSMQDPADGGVYHKLTTLRFSGAVMPQEDTAPRYVVAKSTAAALDFAAVMAMASRVYAPFEAQFPGLPARMAAAGRSAWAWALANPEVIYRQPEDVGTGAYGDTNLEDEFAWAAAELYLLDGEAAYWDAFERHAGTPNVPSWAGVRTLGWISLAQHLPRLPDDAARGRVSAGVLELARQLQEQEAQAAWRVAVQAEDFRWGSSSTVLNQALVMLQGYRLDGGRDLLDAAQSQLDWVLGRNPLGVSLVTGHGLRTPMHVHHRPSQADGIEAPVPGWLSGGPNPGQQDAEECPVPYPSGLPALSWLDHDCSYASNEVAINWTAPLVYVAAAVQALTPKPR